MAQENLAKNVINKGLKNKALPGQQKDKLQSLFQRASNEDHTTIQTKAKDFIERMKYYEKLKKRDLGEDDEFIANDPTMKYFRRCMEKHELLLPIFEKIYRRTLCLQDYKLNDGQCQGIAEACEFIDHR